MPIRLPMRASDDHLALVEAMLRAGQTGRALELLDSVWHPGKADELTAFLRLWALVGERRIEDALEVARVTIATMPGSAAVAFVHAVLESVAGDLEVALESALRATAILPGHEAPEALLTAIFHRREAESAANALAELAVPAAPPADIPSPMAALLAGYALLFPRGSAEPERAILPSPAERRRDPETADRGSSTRRLGWMALAMIVAAIWAIRDPLLASAALAAVVAWLSRSGQTHPTGN